MTPKQLATLMLLSTLWGGSFLFMRIAAPELGPVLLITLRVLIAGLALLAYGAATRTLPALGSNWRRYILVGAINSALPFTLISVASLYFPASVTATLNATTPLFGAVIAALWLGERMTMRKFGGLLLGITGVATLMGLGPIPLSSTALMAAGASLLASISYGVGAVYTKLKLQGESPMALSTYSQLFAALVMLPLAPFTLPSQMPSGQAIASTLALAVLCTSLGYVLYFYLIVNAGPTKATMVTYLAPGFGMLWGVLFLNETLGIGNFIGFALILASVGLVSGSAANPAAVQTASIKC